MVVVRRIYPLSVGDSQVIKTGDTRGEGHKRRVSSHLEKEIHSLSCPEAQSLLRTSPRNQMKSGLAGLYTRYLEESDLHLTGAGIKQLAATVRDGKNGVPTKGSCIISEEGGKDTLKVPPCSTYTYIYGLEGHPPCLKPHDCLGRLPVESASSGQRFPPK